jgi:hypothetical protein
VRHSLAQMSSRTLPSRDVFIGISSCQLQEHFYDSPQCGQIRKMSRVDSTLLSASNSASLDSTPPTNRPTSFASLSIKIFNTLFLSVVKNKCLSRLKHDPSENSASLSERLSTFRIWQHNTIDGAAYCHRLMELN